MNCTLSIGMTVNYIFLTVDTHLRITMPAKNVDVKKEIRGQMVGALANAKFPINSTKDLLAAFPNGADTTCQAGDVKMTAGQAGKLLYMSDFPFHDAEQVADTILSRVKI
jgi:hypothetical protein